MSRRSKYYRYLESGHWNQLRKQAFTRDGFKCTQCGSTKRLRGHHRKYRKHLEDCTLEDIVTLCQPCHQAHHRKKNRLRRLARKPRRGLRHLVDLILNYSCEDARPRYADL